MWGYIWIYLLLPRDLKKVEAIFTVVRSIRNQAAQAARYFRSILFPYLILDPAMPAKRIEFKGKRQPEF